jgi:ribosome biogenesis GTPase
LETLVNREEGEEGLIVAHYGIAVEVSFAADSSRRMIRVKRNSGHVVGDRVLIRDEILARLERKSELSRMDARGNVHLVGANLDILGIVVSCEPLPPPGFIDRAVVAARAASMQPILIINKEDLPGSHAYRAEVLSIYGDSLTTLSLSAASGSGLAQLGTVFRAGLRAIFVGTTGVGKSSILNGLLPDLKLQTGEINEISKRGRHTTTVSTLHTLPEGGELVDSPGFNDFGLVAITARQLALFFPGFEQAREMGCRFRDCRHRDEPDCAVSRLLDSGEIARQRYADYLQLLTEVESLGNEPKYRVLRHRRKKSG